MIRVVSVCRLVPLCPVLVRHYDNDFDTIASFTEQPTQWVVPAGTV
jgi:hypothetical protein